MTTAWSHLPNAAYIDRILADVKVNPDDWEVVWQEFWDKGLAMTFASARKAAWNEYDDLRKAVIHTINTTDSIISLPAFAYSAACYPIMSLIAWPDSGAYLSLSRDQVRVLAALGDQRAILMLPAVMAFAKSRELV